MSKPAAIPALLLLMAGGSSACQHPATSEPTDVVREIFQAAESRHCEKVTPLLTRAHQSHLANDAQACPALLAFLNRHPLLAVRGISDDGRRPGSKIVQVALRDTEVSRSLTLELEGGKWRLKAL